MDEKRRRCRWHQQRHDLNLDTSGFGEAVFLTPYHKAVFKYVQYCTINRARERQVQIIWMQCVDTVPSHFAGFYGSEDALHKEQDKWRHFNARKRKGIVGVVGLCIGMRYRIMDGQIGNLRDWEVHIWESYRLT